MKLDQNICSNNSSAEFENGYDSLKNMAAGGEGRLSLYGYMENLLTLYNSHIYWQIFMKLGQNICPNEILAEIETGSYELKN